MKTLALVSLLITLIAATPVLAASDKSKAPDNSKQGNSQKKEVNQLIEVSVSPSQSASVSPSGSPLPQNCDPNGPWKSHGEYVSCIAKLKQGGLVVSQAARSDIGKKNKISTPSASPSSSPLPSFSPSPSASASALPSISPSPTASGSAEPSATPSSELTEGLGGVLQSQVDEIVGKIKGLLDNLKSLFKGKNN